MSQAIDVSVIIRVRNERNALVRALENLNEQVFNGIYEVIVIDNESEDNSKNAALERGAQVYSLPRGLFTYGRAINLGAARARGSMLVLLSAHAWPLSSDWLQKMVDTLQASANTMGVFCKQLPDQKIGRREALRFAPFSRETFAMTRKLIAQRLTEGESLYCASYFSNSAVILRKDAAERFPMRDLPYAEENAFALDCILDGMQAVYAAELQVVYQGPVSVKGLYHQARRQMIAEKLIEDGYAKSFDADYRYWKVNTEAVVNLLLMPFHVFTLGASMVFDENYRMGSRARTYDYCAMAGIWGRFVGACTWRKYRHTMDVDHSMLEVANKSMTEAG